MVSDLEAPADSADSPRSGVAQITSPADPEEEKRQKTAPFNLAETSNICRDF